jgi:hypothetical protein
MESNKLYVRRDDMSEDGAIRLQKQDDGDIILGIVARTYRCGPLVRLSVEFCLDGGRSEHTRLALQALAEAIELDNKEQPIASNEEERRF